VLNIFVKADVAVEIQYLGAS